MKKAKKKPRTVRLYTSYAKKLYDTVKFSDGDRHIDVRVLLDKDLIESTNRGAPFECVLAYGTTAFAKAHPDAFPHPVIYVYVTRSAVYVVDKKKDGKISHAVRYMHRFSKMTETFDTITKQQFIRRFDGHGFVLKLSPGRKYRAGESRVGGNGTGGSRSIKVSRGAEARARAAGLIPSTTEDMATAA